MSEGPFFECSANKDLVLFLSSYGASVNQILYKGTPMLFSAEEVTFLSENPWYFGQVVGPFAGRLRDGKVGEFQFEKNEGSNALHGSTDTFSFKWWDKKVVGIAEGLCVTYTYPFTLFGVKGLAEATYTVYSAEPRYRLELKVCAEGRLPFNLTAHPYFSLGEEDVSDITLRLNADKRMEYDEAGVPLRYIPLDELYDFHNGKKLTMPIDHAFLLNENKVKAYGKRYGVEFETNSENVVIYADILSKKECGKSKGFTLEAEHHPGLDESMILPSGVTEVTEFDYHFFEI